MFEVLSNGGYDSGCANKILAKDRHQTLTKAMGLKTFDYLQNGSVDDKELDCS